MRKKISFILVLVAMGYLAISFKGHETTSTELPPYDLYYTVNLEPDTVADANVLELGKSFIAFKEALGFKESRGNYFAVNTFGYKGKYQFGRSAMKSVGITDANYFLNNPGVQEKAMEALLAKHKWLLRNYIEEYEGTIINGTEITESGILAAAHLGGAGSVKKYLKTRGRNGFRDGFGTSIAYYFRKFGGYDTSVIEANLKAKVRI